MKIIGQSLVLGMQNNMPQRTSKPVQNKENNTHSSYVASFVTPFAAPLIKPNINFKGDYELYDAVSGNNANYEALKRELDNGADVNYVYRKNPPLAWVVGCKDSDDKYKCIEALLNHPDIDVNKRSSNLGSTALIRAASSDVDRFETIKLLLKHPDIDVNIQDVNKNTVLILASYNGHRGAVEEILKHPDVDVNLKDNDGQTALERAIDKGYTEIAEMIKNYRRGVDRREGVKGVSPQEASTVSAPFNIERMEHMLTSVDPFFKSAGLDDIIAYIDSPNFNPDFRDYLGRDVIHLSMLSHAERIKTVIEKATSKGVDIDVPNISGQTPLIQSIKSYVTSKNDDERNVSLMVTKFILDRNPDINKQDNNGMTAFHYACMTTSAVLLTLILSKKPNVFIEDLKGRRGAVFLNTDKMKEIYENYLKG